MPTKIAMERLVLDGNQSLERLSELSDSISKIEKTVDNLATVQTIEQLAVEVNAEFGLAYRSCILDEQDVEGLAELRSIRINLDKQLLAIKIIGRQFANWFTPVESSQNMKMSRPASPSGNAPIMGGASPVGVCHTGNIRLPRISISKFTGKIVDWHAYNSLYANLVHNNSQLQNVEKFYFLLDSLNVESKNLIRHLPITNENYNLAYNILVERYECRRLLVKTHLSALYDSSKAKSDSPSDLRELLNCFVENLSGLRQMDVDLLDLILFDLLSKKVDMKLLKAFELENTHDIPTFEQLKCFIEKHSKALEMSTLIVSENPPKISLKQPNTASNLEKRPTTQWKPQARTLLVSTSNEGQCPLCGANHFIYRCQSFLDKLPRERYNLVKQKILCVNCLRSSHRAEKCPSRQGCRKCDKPHNTLLHFEKQVIAETIRPVVVEKENVALTRQCPSTSSTSSLFSSRNSNTVTLLATAQISVRDGFGKAQTVRALLDNGSMESFMTDRCRQKLSLSKSKVAVKIEGLGLASSHVTGALSCKIRPRGQTAPQFDLDVFVISDICGKLPAYPLKVQNWPHIGGLRLADPDFDKPGNIDMLLGADIFAHILLQETRIGSVKEPVAINTVFGWILTGKVVSPVRSCTSLCAFVEPLDTNIRRFWELENIPDSNKLSLSEDACEKHFLDTHTRQPDGRFVVALPFVGPEPTFLGSREVAVRRFLALERRLERDPHLYAMYREFMRDYLESGHMSPVSSSMATSTGYYIPHHAVVKPDSATTKLRVVFDASASAPDGGSLNEHLLVGPPLQKDILVLLLHFRMHPVVMTADIKQMYRQILVARQHQNYQKIAWRSDSSEPIRDYKLNTVTYGITSSPFLALRVIQELAPAQSSKFPITADILASDTYVDDLVTECGSVEESKRLVFELDQICRAGGFLLRKWNANVASVIEDLPESDRYQRTFCFEDSDTSCQKILGLQWNPAPDEFFYNISSWDRSCTKRHMVSEIAMIFDPLGLLTPLIFFAKHLIQPLWILGLDWDEKPPLNVLSKWKNYIEQLPKLAQLKIPRWILCNNYTDLQVHGFCDASEAGYAAAVYFRVVDQQGNVTISLVCEKSKVAPTNRISVPRLELCAAVLLSDLVEFVQKTYNNRLFFSGIFAWSDSTVTLAWIRSSSYNWKTFVSNRISHIQDRITPSSWFHIKSHDNPADCASRGLLAMELVNHSLWWTGPHWLKFPEADWPMSQMSKLITSSEMDIEKRTLSLHVVVADNFLDSLLNTFSSLRKILKIISYVRHFIHNVQCPVDLRVGFAENISFSQQHFALQLLVKRVQWEAFDKDINNIRNGKLVSKQLRPLSPFLDQCGVLRVGGRLRNSELPVDAKFPILLPRSHRLTELVILDCHEKYCHPGLRTTQFLLTQNYWILSAKRAIQQCLKHCIRCFRQRPVAFCPPMGDLPASRLTPGKAFLHTGVDFGGPFPITMSRRRGVKSLKAYICLFVCFSTKAIHIELVSDLSTEAFIAALRRFIARRGRCLQIHCDNGTNFVGAARELAEMLQQCAGVEGIEFVFNPPSAPHFGGIWEAGIKSVKSHLKKVVGEQILSYEEFNTILIQIESILNSRPLCPLTNDPNDFSYLTPGHFLNVEPVSVIPDPDIMDIPLSRLNRWQLLQRIQQSFWKRWSLEYLHTLQQKTKWLVPSQPIQVGTLVLICNDQMPPSKWHLGRVETLFLGKDSVCRVANVKTATTILKRPLVKLCPLPIDSIQ